METINFTQFSEKSEPSNADYVVGYDSGENKEIKIPVASLYRRGADGESLEVQYSHNGEDWHFPFLKGDRYMRQRIGVSAWGEPIRIAIESDNPLDFIPIDSRIGDTGGKVFTIDPSLHCRVLLNITEDCTIELLAPNDTPNGRSLSIKAHVGDKVGIEFIGLEDFMSVKGGIPTGWHSYEGIFWNNEWVLVT